MDFNLLSNKLFTKLNTLTEAEDSRYGIDDSVFDGIEEDEDDITENEPQEDQNEPEDDTNEDEEDMDDDQKIDEEEDTGDNINDDIDDIDGDLENDSDETEEQDNINSIPKLEILNLSEKDKKLNNLMILRKFKKLARSANENLNNNIINMTAMTKKQSQLIDIVCDNITKMVDSINDYILYKFDDVYEENVVVYNAFLKRYKTAMELIREIVDDQSKEYEDKK